MGWAPFCRKATEAQEYPGKTESFLTYASKDASTCSGENRVGMGQNNRIKQEQATCLVDEQLVGSHSCIKFVMAPNNGWHHMQTCIY